MRGILNVDMARILVVDDSMFYCLALKSILEDAGHVVVGVASNGMDALKRYEELKPDAVTLDVMMAPDKSTSIRPETSSGVEGLGVLFELKRRDPKAVIIMVTASADATVQTRATALGAAAFIDKPFKSAEIREAISRAIATPR